MIDLSDISVMCVDDDPVIRSMVRSALQRHGCRDVAQTHGGAEALEMCAVRNFDLLICDFQMSPMTGLEFLLALAGADLGSGWPVIMLSAETNPATIQAARELGVCAWVGKPISVHTLIERVGAVLRRGGSANQDPAIRAMVQRQHAKLVTALSGADETIRSLSLRPRDAASLARAMRGELDEIGSHARILGFGLVTTLAERGTDLAIAMTKNPPATARNHGQTVRALGTLVTAMKRVALNRLEGDGDEAGLRLLAKVDDIVSPVRASLD